MNDHPGSKTYVRIDPKYGMGQWVQTLERLNSAGYTVQAHVPEDDLPVFYYVEFDTMDEAALFKLTHL